MSLLQKLAFIILTVSSLSAARNLELSLEQRLSTGIKDGGGLVDCWNALLELKSCTNEIVIFFMNGESYLGLECCRAIRTITHQCWPSMLTSIGFTSEEGDVLCGYCDAETAAAAAPPRHADGPMSSTASGREFVFSEVDV